MTATEQLHEEHELIKEMLQILAKMSERLDTNKPVISGDLEKVVDFIRVFADKCHHGKEEDILFPEIEAIGIPREGGPTGMMLMEHTAGRNYVKAMDEGITRYKAGDKKASSQISKNAKDYINLLREHIDKEENILYPMGDMHFSKETQRKLIKKFERIERERIGSGKHEEFHKLMIGLKKTYLH